MNRKTGTYDTLTSAQKEAMGLLGIGTLLEYFDLFLYVHMAIFLNDLFFPKTDPRTEELLAAFAFCSTYVFRPIGALIFGYIGDTIGRKSTVIITTGLMALSCVTMANLPTYAEIGIYAAYLVTAVRVVQGMASMGEIIGAEVYVTEITKPPIQYPCVTMIAVCGVLGGTAALAVASLVTAVGFNWRAAFWFGVTVATIGGAARTRLRETKDFIHAKIKIKDKIKQGHNHKAKVNRITAVALFFIHSGWPICFYFAYIYAANILKSKFGLSSYEIIQQNFYVSVIQLLGWLFVGLLSYKISPLRIAKIRLGIFVVFLLISPYFFKQISSSLDILFLQGFIVVFGMMGIPAIPIFYKHLPILKRFTYASFTYALSRSLVYVITSFGMVYMGRFFGDWGMLVAMMPMAVVFFYSLQHFAALEKKLRQ